MPRKAAKPQTDLVPDDKNANKGTPRGRALLEDSLRKYGAGRSVLTDRNGKLIAGNKTSEVAVGDLGMPTIVVETDGSELVVVRRTDLDLDTDVAARELAYADNRVGELSLRWDEEQLAADLAEGLVSLTEVGFTEEELAALTADLDRAASGLLIATAQDEDALPDVPARARTRQGDLWQLGLHRLLCGDCRDSGAFARLLGADLAQTIVTSPPYASQRKYDESSPFRPIAPGDYLAWYQAVAANLAGVLAPDGSYFLNIKAHCEDGERLLYVLDLVLAHRRDWGWRYVDEFCWSRNGVPGAWSNRFRNAWEPVHHFCRQQNIRWRPDNVLVESDSVFEYKPSNPKSKTGFNTNNGNRKPGLALPSNVLKIGTETGLTEDHPAPFPVALPEFFILATTDPGDIVLDPFGGAGSTLIAAARNGRRGYLTEISPNYCDVILDRYAALTGEEPIRHDGARWSDVKAEDAGGQEGRQASR